MNLIPSENVTSEQVRRLLATDFGHRYTAPDRFYAGAKFTDEIQDYGEKLACDLFGSVYADLRPLSGHIADMILLFAFTQPGNSILSVSPDHGGYPGISHLGVTRRLGLSNLYFPFDEETMRIKTEQAAETIANQHPRVVVFGASMILFPQPVKQLAKAAHEQGAIVAFDGSHVLGLIAGHQFQDPLREGADILLGSTHKSFFGPQGGMILGNSSISEQVRAAIHPSLVDNAHWNRIAALCQALSEMKAFGSDYARQVTRNSKALGKALIEHGIQVRCSRTGITESHQVVLGYGDYKEGTEIAAKLEQVDIIVDRGVRLGTNEVTRLGMREADMSEIAALVSETLKGSRTQEEIRRDVISKRKEFTELHFCFK